MTNNVTYFSEREKKRQPRIKEEINQAAWGGIRIRILTRIKNGSFGESFPVDCDDGAGVIDNDEEAIWDVMRSEIPSLEERPWYIQSVDSLWTIDILDMVEFCWQNVSKPTQTDYHSFYMHYHLQFDRKEGRDEFRDTINRIFRLNCLAYDLTEEGSVRRLVTPVLHETLSSAYFSTGDSELDDMLEKSCEKFLCPDKATRYEALKILWDAWERLKTLEGKEKKKGIKDLLDTAAGLSSPKFRETLGCNARELTKIGNNFQIRHPETNQEKLERSEHIDYLFHRLFSLIQLILRINC